MGEGYIVDVFDEVVETGDCGELDFTEDGFFEGFRECLIDASGCAFLAPVSLAWWGSGYTSLRRASQ